MYEGNAMLLTSNQKRVLVIGFVAAMIIATFVDLPLTRMLYNPDSQFGSFFKHFASFPGTLLGSMCFSVLTVTNPIKRNLRGLNRAFNGILMVIFGYTLFYVPLSSMGIHQVLWGLPGIAFVLFIAYMVAKLPLEKQIIMRKYAIVGAVTLAGSIVVINALKIVWGRPRYWTFLGNEAAFRLWFIPQGFTLSDGLKSFPSGHCGFAAVTLIYTMLPDVFAFWKGKRKMLLLLSVAWILCTMFSRMILGEHFLSDTLVGVAITVGIFAYMKRRILKEGI
jgi:membrane-associated phospholipid phosphatase